MNINDNIDYWWRGAGRLLAVGEKYLWMGYENSGKMDKIHAFPSKIQVKQICEYHSSFILSASDRLMLYESELRKMAEIP